MATKKTTQVSKEDIYAAALYQAYDDFDEMFAVLRYIIEVSKTKKKTSQMKL
jgi:hypothetical protein